MGTNIGFFVSGDRIQNLQNFVVVFEELHHTPKCDEYGWCSRLTTPTMKILPEDEKKKETEKLWR